MCGLCERRFPRVCAPQKPRDRRRMARGSFAANRRRCATLIILGCQTVAVDGNREHPKAPKRRAGSPYFSHFLTVHGQRWPRSNRFKPVDGSISRLILRAFLNRRGPNLSSRFTMLRRARKKMTSSMEPEEEVIPTACINSRTSGRERTTSHAPVVAHCATALAPRRDRCALGPGRGTALPRWGLDLHLRYGHDAHDVRIDIRILSRRQLDAP